MDAVATHVQANRGHFGRHPYGQWPPGGVIGMRTQTEGAVEERRNGKCRQGRASGGGCGGAVAVVPAGTCRDEEEEFVSERVRARAVEYGRWHHLQAREY
ncbi:unnamed protein product [Sphagnum balticum]